MFEIGDSLREARTRRGLSADDVQKGIRIRERYLSALEEERWEMLPGEAYTKGFLRTYAEFLGLDGQLYVDEYNSRERRRDEEPLVPESLASRQRPSSGALRTLAGALVLASAVGGLAAWRLAGSSPSPAVQQPASGAPAAAAAPAPVVKEKPQKTRAAAAPKAAPAFAVIDAARGACWLSVRAGGPHGAVLFEGILARGATKRFALTHAVWVRMGRPSALDIQVAGHPVGGLPAAPANLLLSRSGAQSA
ncbi:MAG: RodZ domain-containing protein [Gaiellaceae bacterium]|jgi:transcriptional regulator with XRE-family HTH domain